MLSSCISVWLTGSLINLPRSAPAQRAACQSSLPAFAADVSKLGSPVSLNAGKAGWQHSAGRYINLKPELHLDSLRASLLSAAMLGSQLQGRLLVPVCSCRPRSRQVSNTSMSLDCNVQSAAYGIPLQEPMEQSVLCSCCCREAC